MAGQKEAEPTFPDYVGALFDDPIRTETARRGRWLVGVSLAELMIVHFNASLLPQNNFLVSFPDAKAVPSALAFVVFLLLVEFLMRAFMDSYREKEHQLLVAKYVNAQTLERKARAARVIDEQVDSAHDDYELRGEPEPDEWWKPYVLESEKAEAKLDRLDRELGRRIAPITLRAVRLWLEIFVPAVLGAVALSAWALH